MAWRNKRVRISKDGRTFEQIKEHYQIEKELAQRLRKSSRQEREKLYRSLYDEMFRRIPHHPRLTQKFSPERSILRVALEMKMLSHFLREDASFLELGAGDCALSVHVAKFVKEVYAVDVSKVITETSAYPPNFQVVLSDGWSVPIRNNSIDIAYSNQLMEHLHPDDAIEQLQNIFKVLKYDGIYICLTPNRLNGPHDISRYFDNEAKGLHLKEYTNRELSRLFKIVGFSKVSIFVRAKKFGRVLPLFPATLCETVVSFMPQEVGKLVASMFPVRTLLGIQLIGRK